MRRVWAFWLASVLGWCVADAQAIRQEGALVYDGIPETPAGLRAEVEPYTSARQASFMGWLANGGMLIGTRFGDVAQIHRVDEPLGMREQLTFGSEPVAAAAPRPRTNQYVFSRDPAGSQLYQAWLTTESGTRLISKPGTRNQSFVWSQDGEALVWAQLTPGDPDYDILWMAPDERSLPRTILEGDGSTAPLAISHDGSTLLYEVRTSIAESERWLLDIEGGETRQLLPGRTGVSYRGGAFSADDDAVLFTMTAEDGSQDLVQVEIDDGAVTDLVPASSWDVDQFALSRDGRWLAYGVNEDGVSRLWVRDITVRAADRRIEIPSGMLWSLDWFGDGSALGFYVIGPRGADAWSWGEEGGLVRWTRSELGGVDRESLVEPDVFRYESFDGREIPAFLYMPHLDPGERAPVIVAIHGGPEAQERPYFYTHYQYWVNELGAAVVAPNVRGSAGYGAEYLSLDDGRKREDAVRDIGALLDWVARDERLDASRVIVYGESYGGYMVLAAMMHFPDRIRAGIDVVGITNFETFLQGTDGYRRNRRRAEYGDERDPAMREFFRSISPLHNVERIRSPLLVVAGANDVRVPLSESEQVVRRLRKLGRQVWYLKATNEGHGFHRKENQLAQRMVESAFIRRMLLGGG